MTLKFLLLTSLYSRVNLRHMTNRAIYLCRNYSNYNTTGHVTWQKHGVYRCTYIIKSSNRNYTFFSLSMTKLGFTGAEGVTCNARQDSNPGLCLSSCHEPKEIVLHYVGPWLPIHDHFLLNLKYFSALLWHLSRCPTRGL